MLVRAKKITHDDKPRVIAFYGGRRIREGDVLEIDDRVGKKKVLKDGKIVEVEGVVEFSDRWMEVYQEPPKPAPVVVKTERTIKKPRAVDNDVI